MRDVIGKGLFGVVVMFTLCSCGAQQHPGGGPGDGLQEADCQYLKECSGNDKTAYDCVERECRICDVMPDKSKCIVAAPRVDSRHIWCCPPDVDYSTVMSGDTFKQFRECLEANKGSKTAGDSP
jgi:hypothetical protein